MKGCVSLTLCLAIAFGKLSTSQTASPAETNPVSNFPIPVGPREYDLGLGGDFLPRERQCRDCPAFRGNRNVCYLRPQRGFCNEKYLRWYYDDFTGQCRRFYYGGCGGNPNRFCTLRDCRRACQYRERSEGHWWRRRISLPPGTL